MLEGCCFHCEQCWFVSKRSCVHLLAVKGIDYHLTNESFASSVYSTEDGRLPTEVVLDGSVVTNKDVWQVFGIVNVHCAVFWWLHVRTLTRPPGGQLCCWCEWTSFCTSSEKSVFTRGCQTMSTRSRTIIYRSRLMITLYQPPDNCMINIELYSNISWAHTSIWHSNGLPSFSNCKFTSCHTQL